MLFLRICDSPAQNFRRVSRKMRFLDRFLCYLYHQWGGTKMLRTACIRLFSCRERKPKWDLGDLVKRGIYWQRPEERTQAGLKLLLLERWPIRPRRSLPHLSPKSPAFSAAGANRRPYPTCTPAASRFCIAPSLPTPVSKAGRTEAGRRPRRLRAAGRHVAPPEPPPALGGRPTAAPSSGLTAPLLGQSYQSPAVACSAEEAFYDAWEMP